MPSAYEVWVPVNVPGSKVYHWLPRCKTRKGTTQNRVPTTIEAASAVGLQGCANCGPGCVSQPNRYTVNHA